MDAGSHRPPRATRTTRVPHVTRVDGLGVGDVTGVPKSVTLESMFSGRRRTHRMVRALAVDIRTLDGRTCRGLTVDVSRGGALLDLNDGRVWSETDPLSLVAYAALARGWFRNGFEITFHRGGVRADARLVRAVASPKRNSPPFIGCRFVQPLTDEAARRLGLESGGDNG